MPTNTTQEIERIAEDIYQIGKTDAILNADDWKALKPGVIKALSALIEEREKLAEGRGRVAVLTAIKNWGDTVEVGYNKMLEAELSKANALRSEGEKDE